MTEIGNIRPSIKARFVYFGNATKHFKFDAWCYALPRVGETFETPFYKGKMTVFQIHHKVGDDDSLAESLVVPIVVLTDSPSDSPDDSGE